MDLTINEISHKNLKIGDLIVIHSSTRMYVAVFAGLGRIGNVQYYSLPWFNRDRNNKPYKNYLINSRNRVCKFNYDDLHDDLKEEYHSLLKELIKHDIIKEIPNTTSQLLKEATAILNKIKEDINDALSSNLNDSAKSILSSQKSMINNFINKI